MKFEKVFPNIIGTICSGCDKNIPHDQPVWVEEKGAAVVCSVRCMREVVDPRPKELAK